VSLIEAFGLASNYPTSQLSNSIKGISLSFKSFFCVKRIAKKLRKYKNEKKSFGQTLLFAGAVLA
jgi:hypothetical protein